MAAASPGWERIDLEFLTAGKVTEMRAYETRAGEAQRTRFPRAALAAMDRPRAEMARPGSGTWFTARLSVAADGGVTHDFLDDDEPSWSRAVVVPENYRIDLERFPRDATHTPAWLRDRLAEADGRATDEDRGREP
ncbi:hypothetical protein [Cellulomonas marina]|uniref:Uncharacterized protein n=1 Tax=Cellulomonas marina TaxID=988821 RepID=A0A1I0XIT6_9CELL|nr:hypothetical protein [Cellulomonas marina]GIG29852.1 hypothetical protein Cma02nite_24520 [Cellulomonas marina]SFA99873.1 hypothetical protein SAMN05421867_10527 [Cellulomonas marina]